MIVNKQNFIHRSLFQGLSKNFVKWKRMLDTISILQYYQQNIITLLCQKLIDSI